MSKAKAKPKLAPRKAPDEAAVKAFVHGTTPTPATSTPARSTPRPTRKTIYLPPELARRLAVRAAESGDDQSEITARALTAYLDATAHRAPS